MIEIQLIRQTDAVQPEGLDSPAVVAAQALIKAGLQGAFSVRVETGIPFTCHINGAEVLAYESESHVPASLSDGLAQSLQPPNPEAYQVQIVHAKGELALKLSEKQLAEVLTQLEEIYYEVGDGLTRQIVKREHVVIEHSAGALFHPLLPGTNLHFRKLA